MMKPEVLLRNLPNQYTNSTYMTHDAYKEQTLRRIRENLIGPIECNRQLSTYLFSGTSSSSTLSKGWSLKRLEDLKLRGSFRPLASIESSQHARVPATVFNL